MANLENIKLPKDYICNITILNDLLNDLNDWIDLCNDLINTHNDMISNNNIYEKEESTKLMDIQSQIDSILFTIRDRISMIKHPLFYNQFPESIQNSLKEDLDNLYNRCKCRKDILGQ